jgi:hypothetical protein
VVRRQTREHIAVWHVSQVPVKVLGADIAALRNQQQQRRRRQHWQEQTLTECSYGSQQAQVS